MESTGSGTSSSCNSKDNGVKLLDAAMDGLADEVVDILAQDLALIHIADSVGDNALHLAARAGHRLTVSKMFEFLKAGHFHIYKVVACEGNADGDTPLHLAVKNGYRDTFVFLATTCVDALDIENDDQKSPFDLAEEAGIRLPVLQKVLGLLVDIEMRHESSMYLGKHDGDSAEEKWIKLFKAAEGDKEDVVVEILEDDPMTLERKLPEPTGWTVLHVAASNGSIGPLKKMVEFIQNNHDLEWLLLEGDRYDCTPLLRAIEYGHETVARHLVEVAPRAIYKVDKRQKSPLCLAIGKGYLDLVRYMTRSDLPRSIREKIVEHAKNFCIAHNILRDRNLAALQAIAEGLPDVIYLPNEKGWKTLSYAASKGYFEEFKYIVKNFPNSARETDKDGSFPIHKAVAGGHVSIVKEFLLYCPQALGDIDRQGRNLVELATRYQREDVLSFLNGKSI